MTKRMITSVNRTTLAEAALALIQEDGLDALTMRTLADRTGVKAASLYWHVRDRDELLELVADALLARVTTREQPKDWRGTALALCLATGATIAAQRDGDRILHEVPDAVRRSAVYARLVNAIAAGGIDDQGAGEVAAMMIGFVVTQPSLRFSAPAAAPGKIMTLAIDSGSHGVVVRAGQPMEALFRIPHDAATAAPTVQHDERVIVRRLRGGKTGEIEVNPSLPWRVQVQGPTWNTLLDLRGLDLRELHFDSSATKVECILPQPRGLVPIHISSGVVQVRFRRMPATAVVAEIKSGAVKVSLDDFVTRVALADTRWETPGASATADRYELRVSGGAVRVALDASAPDDVAPSTTTPVAPSGDTGLSIALGVVLDGIATRSQA